MFNKNILESSEFYNKRYGNFATKLIYPMLVFFVLILLLSIFTTKEITVKSIGTIYPKKSLAIIQSTSNNQIIKNNMKENKEVSKNDTLIKFNNTDLKSANNLVNSKMNKTVSRLEALQDLKNSVLQNQNLLYSDVYGYSSKYEDYKEQLSELNLSSQQRNSDIKNSGAEDIQKNTDTYISNKLLNTKQLSLKYKMLESINQEISEVDDNLAELSDKNTNVKTENDKQIIKSPASGILHLKNSKYKMSYFPLGTDIAEIYPKLKNNTPLTVEFFIPTYSLNNIKVGQKMKFKGSQQGPKPIFIDGKIKQIDSAATETKQGNFYKVIASINPNHKDYSNIRYGMTGNISVITGKKTWFNYIKDLIYK
ncbi:HlyD family efflux transporter periplasmic adaptor subunit [Fructilactobacillus frigidiflavus]|uniref:HlyD family efflux transporter periplasmic adaptor subunit n=1 Tax=Fructilactobacillus frigidiflavus TaxID=3242688 RepID=UPI0037576A76